MESILSLSLSLPLSFSILSTITTKEVTINICNGLWAINKQQLMVYSLKYSSF